MPDLMDRLYCSEQIHIPPTFPFIMKLYCKAAIRTQPYDLLKWSAAYFRALANGEEPPVKDRIEYPPYDSPSGLTPGYIKVLIKQLGKDPQTIVTAQSLFVKWNCICLEDELLVKLVALMGARTSFNWLKFVAVAAGFISTTLTNTMILLCELLTDEPEGGMATIPLDVFCDLYTFLAEMECGPLTDEEKKQFDELESEEDVSTIAGKIRTAVYEEQEVEGEFAPEEAAEETAESELVAEDDKAIEEDFTAPLEIKPVEIEAVEVKVSGHTVTVKEPEEFEGEGGAMEEEEEHLSLSDKTDEDANASKHGEALTVQGESSKTTSTSMSGENEEIIKEESLAAEPDAFDYSGVSEADDVPSVGKKEKKEDTSKKKRARKLKVEDIEESIRRKIEEKLETGDDAETDEEFQKLGSYLLDASARLKMYTSEEIGFRIFRRYMRQDVPGIGPKVDSEQMEKVFDFMDFNSHKQEGMVMPRNIRHWLCPPLDKVPVPEP